MRKQTKVVAVASAAALLAIGASMTSFAATGWQEEDGVWYYYDNDGNRVEDEWKKSGNNWYWLDSEEGGAMATDKLVDDDGDIYYVDANGVMVTNTWVKVVNEDQDDDDLAEYRYYYMQGSGKAYTAPDTNSVRFRTIDGKRYAFDDDGKMLYGWVSADGEMQNEDDGWVEASYYLGSWEDGAMKTGWQKVTVYDDAEDDDMDYWFYFKSNGKKELADATKETIKEKKVNGKRYGFDERGVMTYQWTVATGSGASSSDWKYFNSPEDGARMTKGWFKVVAPLEDNDNTFKDYGTTFAYKDADEENERWYYADGDGNLAEGEIKKINGKYYGFRPEDDGENKGAAMLSGLVALEMDPNDGSVITRVIDDGVDGDELSDYLDGTKSLGANEYLFYFGDADTDGSMKTGATTINVDGDSYNFLFSKSGGAESKGRGLTGIDDDKYIYKYGCRIKADRDDKYQVVMVTNDSNPNALDINASGVEVDKIKSADLRNGGIKDFATGNYKNDDGETVRYSAITKENPNNYYLVNTSGALQKKKTATKDGDDWYFYTVNYKVVLYANNKNLDEDGTTSLVKDWESLLKVKHNVVVDNVK